MPPSPPKAGSPSAMEAFHATFQGALNDEFEALVRDLRAAAGAVADAADSSGASVDPDAWLSKRALVGELVARWTFLIATYRAHVAAEDEVVLPAVAARVSNVAHAYELEHEAEDELFESITAALDDANRSVETLCATSTTSGEPSSEHVGARERLRAAVQRAARIAHATKTVLQQHLAKEAAHLVPLLNDNFTQEEQADLVERFIASVPSGWVGPVLERGPTRGERGPLRTLLASWLARNRGGGKANETASGEAEKTDLAGVSKRAATAKRAARSKTNDRSSRGKPLNVKHGDDDTTTTETDLTTKKKSPIDHIFQFHAAWRSELLTLEADVLALPPPEKPSARVDALRGLEGRFVFFWGVYRAHSRSEDELVFPALEDKDELHNVSHSYTLDHEHEAELFVDLDACLRDLRVAAGIGDAEDARTSALVSPLNAAEPRVSKAAVNDVERRLQAACAAVRVCLETHVAREEAELWPLFEKHFSETEQRRLVGLIIGRTGAEVLQSMLSWQRKALSENEKAAMIGRLRDASKNTRFASWLDTWWSGEDRAEGREKEGAGSDFGAEGEPEEKRGALDDERTSAAAKADAAMEGLKHVQEYLKDRQQSSQKTSASSAAKAAAAAAAAAAAVDKTGYTPSWDDMFRMNRQQLEASARTLSRDDSLAPERKAYLMQHLLAARWICAQQRNKKNKEDGRAAAERDGGEVGDRDRDPDPRASFGGDGVSGKRARDGANDETRVSDGSELPFRKGKSARVSGKTEKNVLPGPFDSTVVQPGSAAEALALAGTDAVASFRPERFTNPEAGPQDVVLCEPIPEFPSKELGCKHYSRGARLVAACCGAAHVCRFCHDEAEDHTIDRFATKEMVCMRCGERQPSSATCRGCGVAPAKYFCSVCNFWDDAEDAYHCPFCNVCRRGKGLGKDFFHCMQCNSCVSLTMGPHDCGRGGKSGDDGEGGVSAMESDCPVCKDFLWNSDTPVKAMPCGHMMHTRCFEAYTKHYYTCPLCRKSLGDFSAYFRMLDAILAEEREANEKAARNDGNDGGLKTTQRVACNDCGEETVAPFHFVYHACAACRSYNTRVLGGPETTNEKDAEEKKESVSR